MLKLSKAMTNKPIISLRTGQTIGTTTEAIINPHNLKIEGFYTNAFNSKEPKILLEQDIREIDVKGLAVNDTDALSDTADLIRLKEVIELDFSLIGKKVVTVNNDKVGKVIDYAADTESLFIQKLYVSKPMIRNIAGGSLVIDRSQVNEITPKKIVINDLLETSALKASAAA